jgi:hypothetical protein
MNKKKEREREVKKERKKRKQGSAEQSRAEQGQPRDIFFVLVISDKPAGRL